MSAIDPTRVRLSDDFLLSDFVGNYSAYHEGIANPVTDQQQENIEEGCYLAFRLSEISEDIGPCRVSYGYIHPSHSMATVKWRDPADPSLHRWDMGACADVCFVHRDRFMGGLGYWDECNDAPINTALWISREYANFTRMITYEQSPWICFGTDRAEVKPRKRFYEYRFVGPGKKFEYIKHNGNAPTYLKLMHNWKGQGYPRRGKEYQHIQTSATTFLSDFLYDKNKVHKGVANKPPINGKRAPFMRNVQRAGKIIDRIHEHTRRRVSIVKAYDAKKESVFLDGFQVEMVPALGIRHDEVADIIRKADPEVEVKIGNQRKDVRRIRMTLQSSAK